MAEVWRQEGGETKSGLAIDILDSTDQQARLDFTLLGGTTARKRRRCEMEMKKKGKEQAGERERKSN